MKKHRVTIQGGRGEGVPDLTITVDAETDAEIHHQASAFITANLNSGAVITKIEEVNPVPDIPDPDAPPTPDIPEPLPEINSSIIPDAGPAPDEFPPLLGDEQ